ncbi:MAG: hypothetical protein ACR2FR_02450 [Rubrobacter sp.]
MASATTTCGLRVADQEPYTENRRHRRRRQDHAKVSLVTPKLLHVEGQEQEHPESRRDPERPHQQQHHHREAAPPLPPAFVLRQHYSSVRSTNRSRRS